MRQIIPKEISEMIEIQTPYLHYETGRGMVLNSDAPSKIKEIREKTLKWFEEHDMK